MTNKEFSQTEGFKTISMIAGVKASKRQASKFRIGKGDVYRFFRYPNQTKKTTITEETVDDIFRGWRRDVWADVLRKDFNFKFLAAYKKEDGKKNMINEDMKIDAMNEAFFERIKFFKNVGLSKLDAEILAELGQVAFYSALGKVETEKIKRIVKKYQGKEVQIKRVIKYTFPSNVKLF